jgi:hypothetical protein
MNYYAHIDTDNILLGYYNIDTHDTIPTPNVKLTEEQWQSCLNLGANKINSDGTCEVVDVRTLEQKSEQARGRRDYLLSAEVDPIVTNPLRWAELTDAKQAEWTQYRLA